MANKLIELRKLMKENNIDAYIITKFDPHQTEYADSYYNATQFISNFTGSNATIVVTDLEAGLWTDNRYFLQAEKELGEEFTLHKMGEKGTIDVLDFASKYKTIGIDFSTYPAEAGKKLEQKIKKSNVVSSANGNLIDIDLISPLWQNREFAKRDGIFLFRDDKEESLYLSKINQVRSLMKTPYYIISSLDDIAWVLNIRALGEFNTFNFLAYLFIEPKNIILFIDSISGGGNNIGDVFPEGLEIKPYSEVFDYIKNKTSGTISIAPARTNYKIYKAVQNPNILKHDITTTLKARKDEQEINLIKEAN
ncbi:MAG: aminopeptidase P family N-terminal domain-containing protein, partial [Defluviitaleaceae bacterium]|nr:aminopeptidase P family N-terminal domain-containing protein [Defluviitaleaceae bacterium]